MNFKKTIFPSIKKIFNTFGLELSRKKGVREDAERNAWLTKFQLKTVIDIGANDGEFASKIKKILPTCKIICFEPVKEPFNKLKEKYGKDETMTLNNFALGSKSETKTIFKNSFSPSSSILDMADRHRESFPFTKEVTEEKIRVETLDNIASTLKIEKPFMVKMDVQGYEKFVIEGGLKTIRQADVVITELSYKELYKDQPLFDEVYTILSKNNFVISGILEQLRAPHNGEFLQCDAVFVNKNSLQYEK